jgi:tetratricopeptide (TPR) repeat protein
VVTLALSADAIAMSRCTEGAALAEAGEHDAAILCYMDAVALAPTVLDLHLILANAQQLNGQILDARETLRTALRIAARDDATSEFALGKALVDAGAGADAVACFQRARAAFPHDAAVVAALAAALRDAQRPDEAWTAVQAALRIAPADPVALLTAAMIRHDLADFGGALHWCEASLRVRPDAPGARLTRAYLRFLTGDEIGGWQDFEARPLPQSHTSARDWRGEPLDGRSILVMGEQGTGDQFQFLRFVHHPVIQAAARVIVSCQAEAVSLVSAAGFQAISRETRLETDFSVPLLSLPHRLGLCIGENSYAAPYLRPAALNSRGPSTGKRVGIVWSGNPAHRNDAARSIPAALMHRMISAHPDLQIVCMQHGVTAQDIPSNVYEFPVSGDWLATATELCTLDLLISVDTGIAHLAGALGVPVWLLLPHVPDWRWGARGDQTPWYITMRLFRQTLRGDWRSVLARVSRELQRWSAARA